MLCQHRRKFVQCPRPVDRLVGIGDQTIQAFVFAVQERGLGGLLYETMFDRKSALFVGEGFDEFDLLQLRQRGVHPFAEIPLGGGAPGAVFGRHAITSRTPGKPQNPSRSSSGMCATMYSSTSRACLRKVSPCAVLPRSVSISPNTA